MYQIYLQGCIIIVNIFLHTFRFVLLDKRTGPVPDLSQILNELLIIISVSENGAKALLRSEFEPSFGICVILFYFYFVFKQPLEKQAPLFWAEQDPGHKWIWMYLELYF